MWKSVRRATDCTVLAGAAFALLASVVVEASDANAADDQIRFLAGGAAGDWYRYLTAKSECIRQFSDMEAIASPTSGGMEAFHRAAAGQADFAYMFQNSLYQAWHGEGDFEGNPVKTLMPVGMALEPSMTHLVVLEGSDITTLQDLRGKKVSPGPTGTVSYSIVSQLLDALGIMDEVTVANISHDEQVSYLSDGKIDAFGITHTMPSPPVVEVSVSNSVRLLSLQQELEDVSFFDEHPYFLTGTIPAKTYSGVDYDVHTAGVGGVLLASTALPDEKIYAVMEVLWGDECIDYLTQHHRGLAHMAADNPTENVATPLHPAAAKFWQDRGIEILSPTE